MTSLKLLLLPGSVYVACRLLGLSPEWTTAMVLTSSDLYLCMAVLAVLLIVLIPFGPTRIYPPRAPS